MPAAAAQPARVGLSGVGEPLQRSLIPAAEPVDKRQGLFSLAGGERTFERLLQLGAGDASVDQVGHARRERFARHRSSERRTSSRRMSSRSFGRGAICFVRMRSSIVGIVTTTPPPMSIDRRAAHSASNSTVRPWIVGADRRRAHRSARRWDVSSGPSTPRLERVWDASRNRGRPR